MISKKKPAEISRAQLAQIANLFRTLSEPTRLEILHTLSAGELSVSALTEQLDAKQANVSKQLGILRQASLVQHRRDGNTVYYQISDPLIFELCELVCDKMRSDAANLLKKLGK